MARNGRSSLSLHHGTALVLSQFVAIIISTILRHQRFKIDNKKRLKKAGFMIHDS